ncbi:MAG TPA: glucokinase, partial [Nitrospiria bacterium]|nr:glucokinase [Nitrospiria bacterium]
ASREYGRFDDLLAAFLKEGGHRPDAVCLGVAGPVREGRCQTTNLPWVLEERELGRAVGARAVKLLNDVEAAAFGVLGLRADEVVALNPGRRAVGNIAVIAAGTGLGEAILAWDGRRYVPVPSEGGHTDFAPRTDREIDLLRFLRAEFGRVSYERVVSGPGQYNIYRFLRDTGTVEEPAWLTSELAAGDPSAVVTRVGLAKGHPLCVDALDLFAALYGAEAGNLALKAFAIGGVFIAGGIAPKMIDKLRDGVFMAAFAAKGRYRSLMESIPVSVSLNPRTPLLGAARYAVEHLVSAAAS